MLVKPFFTAFIYFSFFPLISTIKPHMVDVMFYVLMGILIIGVSVELLKSV